MPTAHKNPLVSGSPSGQAAAKRAAGGEGLTEGATPGNLATTPSAGLPTWAIVLMSVAGVAAVGGVLYVATRKKGRR